MKSFVRSILSVLLVAALAGGIVWSFWPQPVLVELDTVRRGKLRVTVDEDGKTRIKKRYVVSSPLAGRLLRIELDPGDRVCRGNTLLATIEPNEPEILDIRAQAQAQARVKAAETARVRAEPLLERARVELEYAKRELDRVSQLVRTNAESQIRLEAAEMLYRAREQDHRAAEFAEQIAGFELNMAQAALLRSRPQEPSLSNDAQFPIVSPITGQVLRVFQESATVVQAGTPLIELGDSADLEVEVDVLSRDGVRIRPGTEATLEQWGGDGPLMATVRLVEPSAFTKISALGVEEQRVNVILDLDEPAESRNTLGDGYRVEARIVIWQQDGVLQVSTGALFRQNDAWAVFVVTQGTAVLRTVKIDHRHSLAAEVTEGLREGEQVVLHPSDKVRDGVRVQPRDLSAG